jgi:hypothetical protein
VEKKNAMDLPELLFLLATSLAVRMAALTAVCVLPRCLRRPAKVAAEVSCSIPHVIIPTTAAAMFASHKYLL